MNLAIALAAGQVLADVPEGYATVANFRDKGVGVPRRRRILLSASFVLFSVDAGLISYFLLRGAAEGVKVAALAFVAGMLAVAAVEDMLEEAREDTRGSVLAFVGGLALFTLVSAGLEAALGSGIESAGSERSPNAAVLALEPLESPTAIRGLNLQSLEPVYVAQCHSRNARIVPCPRRSEPRAAAETEPAKTIAAEAVRQNSAHRRCRWPARHAVAPKASVSAGLGLPGAPR